MYRSLAQKLGYRLKEEAVTTGTSSRRCGSTSRGLHHGRDLDPGANWSTAERARTAEMEGLDRLLGIAIHALVREFTSEQEGHESDERDAAVRTQPNGWYWSQIYSKWGNLLGTYREIKKLPPPTF